MRIWVWIALVLVFLEVYLTVNKIWIRKHKAAVADSVSISAQLLALTTGIPFVALYVVEGAYEGAIADSLFLIVNVIMIAIGAGLWVEGHRNKGLLVNVRRALRLEKSEASALINNFLRPTGARHVLAILHGLALIDREMGEKERELIEGFAEKWNIDLTELVAQLDDAGDGDQSFASLHRRVQQYLRLSPPPEQVRQLSDVITSLVQIDNVVTAEEELIVTELNGLLDSYAGGKQTPQYSVFIAPQSNGQIEALKQLLPQLSRQKKLGGEVLAVGKYYSSSYAELVCSWYRDMGFLTFRTGERAKPLAADSISP